MSEPNNPPPQQNLAESKTVGTVNDMMGDLAVEIAEIKAGTLPESKARIISTYRRLMFRGVELTIQASRLERKLAPALRAQFERQSPVLPAVPVVDAVDEAKAKTDEQAKQLRDAVNADLDGAA